MSTKADHLSDLNTATFALITARDALALLIENDLADMDKVPDGVAAIIRMVASTATSALQKIGADA